MAAASAQSIGEADERRVRAVSFRLTRHVEQDEQVAERDGVGMAQPMISIQTYWMMTTW